MERKTAAEILSQSLDKLYGYCYSKLYDKEQAEDLTNDIICCVLENIEKLKCDEAFYGYMWKIAENRFKAFIRKKNESFEEYNVQNIGCYLQTPESQAIYEEDINLLRRELSLLSKQYRDVTVAYYIQNQSCSDIAKAQNVSIEMVKYYLFKSRKILKESIEMSREFGEKSYNPGMFRPDFWGGNSNPYFKLFDRKLPGNIVLAAYEKPLTVQQLSVELGVSVPYLEEELEILSEHQIITENNGKYQTNIIIFKEDYENEAEKLFEPIFKPCSALLKSSIDVKFAEIKEKYFNIAGYDDNRIKWSVINLILMFALDKANESCIEKYGDYPKLSNGSCGFVYGYDNDYAYHHFNGIYGSCENKAKTAAFTAVNYRIIEACQKYQPTSWHAETENICNAMLVKNAKHADDIAIKLIKEGYISVNNGKLCAEFPVFKKSVAEEFKTDLAKEIEAAADCMAEICFAAAKVLKKYTPKHLQPKCEQLSFIRHQMDVMAFITEEMVESGYLTVPQTKTNLCMYGIIND